MDNSIRAKTVSLAQESIGCYYREGPAVSQTKTTAAHMTFQTNLQKCKQSGPRGEYDSILYNTLIFIELFVQM